MFQNIGIVSILVAISATVVITLMAYIVYLRKLLNGNKTTVAHIQDLSENQLLIVQELEKRYQKLLAERNKLDAAISVAKDINTDWQNNYNDLMKTCNLLKEDKVRLEAQVKSYRESTIEFRVTPEEQALLEKIINLVIKHNVSDVATLEKIEETKTLTEQNQ